jgi:peptidoglycan biosynthesis protein MviN/MurJ (putative lipid II flippase)
MSLLEKIYHYPTRDTDVVFMILPILLVLGILLAIYFGLERWLGKEHVMAKILRMPVTVLLLLFWGLLALFFILIGGSSSSSGNSESNKVEKTSES